MDACLARHRDPGGQVGGQERGALRIGRSRREVEHPLVVDGHALGIAPAGQPRERDDAPPVDVSGDLVAEHGRQLGRLRVLPVLDQDVGEVDSCGLHVDDRLAVARLGLRHVLDGERRAHLFEDRRPH
jgi:hypothetical protein